MQVRTRFAPSPTGHVHIGNMRAAIYAWLYARGSGGVFLLRLEDTDRERSTPEAIETVLDAMRWLGLDYDEEPLYQSSRLAAHQAAAETLIQAGSAYGYRKGEGGEAVMFRIPWDGGGTIREVGPAEIALHPEAPVKVDRAGIIYSLVSRKGTPAEQSSCLAGMRGLKIFDAGGTCLFSLDDHVDGLLAGSAGPFETAGGVRMTFLRREVCFNDIVKGPLSKPLDGMNDFVIVRSDGNPVFHLANVCDDMYQRVTHIIRGDDHVENTFRHVMMFRALGAEPPAYAHLPMIVNDQGKPYSKRDGDAFVGDFREKGYLGEALFNYLALLGWSPGGEENEVLTRAETVRKFDLSKVKASPAKVDLHKLQWLNASHMAAMPREEYHDALRGVLRGRGLWPEGREEYFLRVVGVMGERIKTFADIADSAVYFFTDDYPYDDKAVSKRIRKPGAAGRLLLLAERFEGLTGWTAAEIEAALVALAAEKEISAGDLIHPARVAVSGVSAGPGLFEMLETLGRERVVARLRKAAAMSGAAGEGSA